MARLTLLSSRERPLKPLIEGALRNELRLLTAGIRRTNQNLRQFEARYGIPSADFLRRYENDELDETLDFAEWVGECHMLARLQEKVETLRDIQLAN